MDFLDSLDLDTSPKKCHRVRSWYLYEQYKSLEKNQLDAAERLKNKSYQDKILRQEIKERRERRSLCSHFGSCQSDSKIEKTIQRGSSKAPLSVKTDDLYESFCDLHDEHLYDFEDNLSRDDSSETSKNFEEFKSVDNKREDSDNESVRSVIKNVAFDKNLADDVKGELEIVKKNIAENINLQLETVKENIECLKKFTTLGDTDNNLPEDDSLDLFEQCESSEICAFKQAQKFTPKNNKDFFPTWAKLVAFAYETIQFNHGNFYNEFSSQIMLAVLLCDVLRRGIIKMCHILQPYVSPIKYATSDSEISFESYKSVKRKTGCPPNKCLSVQGKKASKLCNSSKHQKLSCKRMKSCRKLRWLLDREYQSENKWYQRSKHSFDNRNEMRYGASEPWHNVSKFTSGPTLSGKSSSISIWPEEFSGAKLSEDSVCKCKCLRNVATPILKVARYIEGILQDIED